jgi:hypothetical protein
MANSTSTISNTVSTFIDSQIPQFIRDNDPNFGAFIKAYYAWMETTANNDVINQSKQLLSYNDVDSTTDGFIQYFINDFLPYFPNDTVLDSRKLIKAARNFYQKKGSVESVQFLFRVLYGKEADIYYPKNQVLRCSDGKWYLPRALRLVLSEDNVGFNVNLLVGRQGLGSNSNASCVIESATLTVDQGLGIELVEVYVSNVDQVFDDLENLNVIYGYDANNNPLIFSEKIIASLSNIVINPNYRGSFYKGYSESPYYSGDPVVISGGLEPNDTLATKAIAYVNSVTSGSITGANVIFGGYGYRLTPNTNVTVVPASTDTTGTGAEVIIQSIDTPNAIYMNVNIDSISGNGEYLIALNAASFNFANFAYTNANTTLAQAFSWQNLEFAAITSMNVLNGGGDYTAVPTFDLAVTYFTDLLNEEVGNPILQQQNMQYVDDLGIICYVAVGQGGNGYSNVTDAIYVPGCAGYGATFNFITAPTTNAITSVIITNPGEGYIDLPLQLIIANSTNNQNVSAGSNAYVTAYGYGQAAIFQIAVNQIGQIIDFRLPNRGFDYISTPNISLRVADIYVNPMNLSLLFPVDSPVYQGASINAPTWIANVDSYNVSTSTLRVYNYKGAINAVANLVGTTTNATINISATGGTINSSTLFFPPYVNYTVYGNGLAKANAIFLNGLIQYPGFYLTTDGQLSSDQHLQDSNTYHNYSYVIVVEKALKEYKQTLLDLVHPIGTSMLGSYSVIQSNSNYITPNTDFNLVPSVSGNVNIDSSIVYSGANNIPLFESIVSITPQYESANITFANTLTTFYLYMAGTPVTGVCNFHWPTFAEGGGTNGQGLTLQLTANTGGGLPNCGFFYSNNFSGFSPIVSQQPLTPNTWHQIQVEIDPTGTLASWYADGVLQQSGYNNFANANSSSIYTDLAFWTSTDTTYHVTQISIQSLTTGNVLWSDLTTDLFTPVPWVVWDGANTSSNVPLFLVASNVAPNVNGSNTMFGTGTDFGVVGNVGDMIIFNTSDDTRKLQAKLITAVVNTTTINLESNTTFAFYPGNVTSGSNTITANYAYGNIAPLDIVKVNVNNNVITCNVLSLAGQNTIYTDQTFAANGNNLVIMVYPLIVNASYAIVEDANNAYVGRPAV